MYKLHERAVFVFYRYKIIVQLSNDKKSPIIISIYNLVISSSIIVSKVSLSALNTNSIFISLYFIFTKKTHFLLLLDKQYSILKSNFNFYDCLSSAYNKEFLPKKNKKLFLLTNKKRKAIFGNIIKNRILKRRIS